MADPSNFLQYSFAPLVVVVAAIIAAVVRHHTRASGKNANRWTRNTLLLFGIVLSGSAVLAGSGALKDFTLPLH